MKLPSRKWGKIISTVVFALVAVSLTVYAASTYSGPETDGNDFIPDYLYDNEVVAGEKASPGYASSDESKELTLAENPVKRAAQKALNSVATTVSGALKTENKPTASFPAEQEEKVAAPQQAPSVPAPDTVDSETLEELRRLVAKAEREGVTLAEQSEAAAGSSRELIPGLWWDDEKKILGGPDGRGMIYIGFEYDANQNIFQSSINPWQRYFGFCQLYDICAPVTMMFYDTVRLKFDYGEYNWMVQIWKGQYGITSGAEMGIYHKPTTRATEFYDCATDENMVYMSFDVYKNGKFYFQRAEERHWWLTGFVLGEASSPSQLEMRNTITLKDKAMLSAFCGALEENNLDYTVAGLKVSFTW